MDSGQAKEFDTPYNLLRIPTTLFTSLVNATGQGAKLKIAAAASNRGVPLSAIAAEAEWSLGLTNSDFPKKTVIYLRLNYLSLKFKDQI